MAARSCIVIMGDMVVSVAHNFAGLARWRGIQPMATTTMQCAENDEKLHDASS